MSRGILLVDHGSRREAANRRLVEMASKLEQYLVDVGPPTVVEAAHMEIADPDIAAGVAACVRRGVTRVVVVPCMISRGRHVSEDIPRLLAAAALEHAAVQWDLAAPLSEQDGFVPLLAAAAASADGRGASDSDVPPGGEAIES